MGSSVNNLKLLPPSKYPAEAYDRNNTTGFLNS